MAWLSTLETSFIAFRLPTFRSNLRKRIVKMPKPHFYDSGLVCWLLGIRTPEQLRSHPLRGAIFESWVVSEIAKHRVNRGESGGLSFYRDHDAAEADLVIECADRLTLVEAKSAQTASASLFDGANRVQCHLDDPSRPCDAAIAHGGEESQRRSDAKLLSRAQLHDATRG